MTTVIHRRRGGRTAATAAVALVGATMAMLPTSAAQAAVATTSNATLSWGFSTYANDFGVTTAGSVSPISPTPTTSSFDGGQQSYTKAQGFTLGGGTGSIDSAGSGTIDFAGSVTYSPFAQYGTLVADKSTVTFADFQLQVLSATEGVLKADVSYHKPSSNLPATEVTVATFDIASLNVSGNTFQLTTAAPDWTNAVPMDKYAAGYRDSWPAPLVDALRTQVEASQDPSVYFFRTGNSAANDNKAPKALRVTAGPPAVTATVTALSPTAGVSIRTDGVGFTGVTNPGDDGVYVGLAPSGGLPATGSMADQGKFLAADWVTAAAMPAGTFSRTLTAPAAKLDPTKKYSIYTWQAHAHSNATQDTETPVTINWEAFKTASPVAATWKTKPKVEGKKSKLDVSVGPGATGEVTVTLVKKGAKKAKKVQGTLVDGAVQLQLPKLTKGRWTITVAYSGDVRHLASQTTTTVKVKAKPKAKKKNK